MHLCLSFFALVYFVGAEESYSKGVKNNINCDVGDCATECNDLCGCERAYFYNATLNECVYDSNYVMNLTVEKFALQEKIRSEAENIFKLLIISAFFIAGCFTIGVISSCYYCFRVQYTDHILSRELKELEKRVGKKGKKISLKQHLEPIAESCNIMIEDAGIMVV